MQKSDSQESILVVRVTIPCYKVPTPGGADELPDLPISHRKTFPLYYFSLKRITLLDIVKDKSPSIETPYIILTSY